MTVDPTDAFDALVSAPDPAVPLDEAALLVAAHALPDLDLANELRRLDTIAAAVEEPTLRGLCRHLLEVEHLAGDRATYHDPANSLLPSVLDRRLGIPLSLAIVAIEVGRRVGVPVLGIGMPGHFLIRAEDDPLHFVDLFDGGRVLDAAACQALYRQLQPRLPWDDRHLVPVSSRAMLARLLANLVNSYRRNGDRRSLCWAAGLRCLLPGVGADERRELALVLGAAGRYGEAADLLEVSGEPRDLASAQRLRARLN